MAADDVSGLPTSQIDESNIKTDIPTYKVDDVHAMTGFNVGKKVEPSTIQSLLSFQKEERNCRPLSKYADTLYNSYLYDKLGIFQGKQD